MAMSTGTSTSVPPEARDGNRQVLPRSVLTVVTRANLSGSASQEKCRRTAVT